MVVQKTEVILAKLPVDDALQRADCLAVEKLIEEASYEDHCLKVAV